MGKKTHFKTWQVKNQDQEKAYGKGPNQTDYDIPAFGYLSALYMVVLFALIGIGLPYLCLQIGLAPLWPTTILGGVLGGFGVAYLQIVREKKGPINRDFYLIGLTLSVVIGGILFFLFRWGILL